MARFCSECGIPLPDRASFCPSCGASALDQWLASREVIPVVEPPPEAAEPIPELRDEGEAPREEPPPEAGMAEPVLGEAEAAEDQTAQAVRAESAPAMALTEMIFALRFLFDRQRMLWYGSGVVIGWMLLAVFHLLAYVAGEESPKLALGWRLGGWGAFLATLAVTSAILAASLITDVGTRWQLSWRPPSRVLQRMPAIVGPVFLFLGIAGASALILMALGMLARYGAIGRILWALLLIPQFLAALVIMVAGVGLLAALVYGPALAVTDGGTFSQTLYRLSLLFTRESARALGYLLLGFSGSSMLWVLSEGGIGLMISGIARIAVWASQGQAAPILVVGRELVSACVPGSSWFLIGASAPIPSMLDPEVRLAGFLWAISVIALTGVGATVPLFLLSGFGAIAAWTLLGRLAQRHPE
ncbi:hypothetical protein HRbin08_02235 [bacterium HR08]|nr:hypothetical protein HRbin08_02235 [bacterium HR08]